MGEAVDPIELLVDSEFFQGLDREALGSVFEAARKARFSRHEVIFRQDDPAGAVYLLTAGRVKLTQLTADGQQVLLRFVERGEMVGGIAVLTEATYPVTAEAVDECDLLVWDGATMHQLMKRLPEIALNAVEHLARRVQDLQRRVRELTTERVEQRIARALIRLAAQAGERTSEGVRIAMPLTRQDLGELTGTTLFTVSRTLSRWESEGLIKTGRERIVIRSPHGLAAIADDLPSL